MTGNNYLNRYFNSIKKRRYKRQRAVTAFCLFAFLCAGISGVYLRSNPIIKTEDSYICEFKEPFSGEEADRYKLTFHPGKLEISIAHEKTHEKTSKIN